MKESPRSRNSFPGVILSMAGLMLSPLLYSQEPEFNPRTAVARSFPPIVEPETVDAEKAEEDGWVRDEELVLGVALGGEARAYPINTLTGPRREIINDKLGGQAIAATW